MLNKVSSGLLYLILIELVLGGGGRLVSSGPVSLRMVLFSMAIVITLIHFKNGSRLEIKYLRLLVMFTLMIIVGALVAISQKSDIKLVWEDIKPLLFFYLLPFFVLTITSESDLRKIGKTIYSASVVMALLFLIILFLLFIRAFEFLDFYNVTISTEEFFFRGEVSFFYKGFIYLCIGFLFIHLTARKEMQWLLIVLILAIVLNFTRGLIFALSLCYLVYYLFVKRAFIKIFATSLLCLVVLFLGKPIYASLSNQLYSSAVTDKTQVPLKQREKLLGDREFSDTQRKLQIKQVADAITLTSIAWGHGFGNGVESRPIHMEISYLEIFHKQGIIGLACWAFILFNLFKSFKSRARMQADLSSAYFLSALFVFFQSLTNQYINNPIGLGMILISQVSLDVLSKKHV